MAIPLMLATLIDERDFGSDWQLERKLDGGGASRFGTATACGWSRGPARS